MSTPHEVDAGNVACPGDPNVNLLIDPNNCGYCGHKCAECVSGLCKPERVGTCSNHLQHLTMTDSSFFIATGQQLGEVSWQPRDGGPQTNLLTYGTEDFAYGVAIDGENLFVNSHRGLYILTAHGGAGSGKQDLIASSPEVRFGLGQSPTTLYWVDSASRLLVVDKSGGQPRPFGEQATPGAGSTGLAGDSDATYWVRRERTDDASVHSILSLTASGSVKIPLSGLEDPRGLAVDGTYVYWASGTGHALYRAERSGNAAPQKIAEWSATLPIAKSLTLDDSFVYVVLNDPGDPSRSWLLRAPKGCNGSVETLAKQYIYSNVVVDGAYLYWTSTNMIVRIPRDP